MYCNHKAISVTRNLMDALHRFRRPDASRVLWADAICINQDDVEERGSQVQLMARIYSEASRVLIWLGHGDPITIQAAFKYICQYVNHCSRDYLIEGEHATYRWNGEEVDVETDDLESFNPEPGGFVPVALEHFFTRPYFRRGWVVQEIVLPGKADMFWGLAQIDFHWFCRADHGLRVLWSPKFSGDARDGLWAIAFIQRLRGSAHEFPTQYPFSKLLMYTREQKFSDPRDRIYGLLGLAKICCELASKPLLLRPDYSISMLECYKRATETLLTECKDTSILSLVKYDETSAGEWPSWVPRVHKSVHHEPYYRSWSAGGHLETTLSKQIYGGYEHVRIKGIRVAGLKSLVYKTLRDAEDVQKLLLMLDRRYGEHCVAWTASAGEVWNAPLCVDAAVQSRHLDDYRIFVNHDFTNLPLLSNSSDSSRRAKNFHKLCSAVLTKDTIFETDEDLLGTSSSLVQPGDQVVIFFGGNMPFILRPVGNRWRLVGTCFVYGIMQGEVIEQWEHSTKYTAEDFDIF